jgi:adenylate cyclase
MATDGTESAAEAGGGGISAEEVRAELQRILGHPEFEATERLRSFLTFVVEESLAGRTEAIRGREIARRVFGRGEDFDPARDPVVRIEAARLRRRLEHYYFVAGGHDPIRIDIPKGRYVPDFTRRNHGPTPGAPSPARVGGDPVDPGPTVAIVPFRDLTADPDWTFFGPGLVAELIHEVNRYENVIAVPGQPTATPGDDGGDAQVARFILEGSVRRDDVELKIVVHLTDTLAVRQLWGESYKLPLDAGRLIAVQEELARDLMAAVADEYGVISRRLTRESRDKPPAELSTYEALLRYHYYMLVMTAEAGEAAFVALQRATEREPDYGPGWSAFANLHVHAWLFDRPGPEEPLATAFEYAKRGVTLAPDSQLARTILAYLHILRGERELFVGEAEAALALNPSSPNYAGTIGYLFAVAGDFDRGEALLRQAFESGPAQPGWFHHGLFIVQYARGEYEKAFREVERVLPPAGFWDPALRAAALGKLGRRAEAEEALEELRRLKPDFEDRVSELLSRTPIPSRVRVDVLDGLRRAGLREQV